MYGMLACKERCWLRRSRGHRHVPCQQILSKECEIVLIHTERGRCLMAIAQIRTSSIESVPSSHH
jgi:hypothetical protein